MKTIEQRGYTNIIHLAEGGEGDVYTCEKQGVKYLVKIVAALDDEQTELLRKVNSLRNVYFPRIIDIFGSDEKTIIIREYIEGVTLAEEIKKNGAYAYHRAKEIIFDICSALHALHAMKPHPIIYRDLKPDNVIVTPDGQVCLIDFGIARYFKQESTRDTVLAGTKGYTAPEVMAGMQSDERSDVYSIGLVFYELLSGKSLQDPPYQIRPVAENNEFSPPYVDEVIAKATDIDQINRYANIDEFVYELEHIKEIKAKQKKKKRRRTWLITLAAAIVLAAAAVIAVTMLAGERIETLLSLDFEDEADIHYIGGYQNPEGRFEVSDGALHVLREGCNLDYRPENNMVLHFRMKTTNPGGAVGLGPFRINPSLEFECVYFDQEKQEDVATGNQKLNGFAMANSGQWLDLMLYTNAENSAVYAVVCDNESGSIAYAAYQVPAYFGEDDFAVEMMAFFNGENEYMMIDHIHIAEGSLRQYLRENMPAYTENKQRVDAFLNQDVSVLPQMVFKPMNGPETILNLQFDSQEDAGWLEIHGENTENIVPQDCVKDGVFALEQEAALKYILEPGQMVHIRAKASGIMRDGSVYFIDLNPVGSPALPRERPLWLRFNVGSNEPYRLEAQRPNGYAPLTPADSAMLARADELVDVLVWLDDQDQSVRYIISDPNSAADIACIGVMLDEEYVSDGWNVSLQVNTIGGNDASSGGDLQTDIAFIRASTGPIKAYLEQNIPAYSAHQARVDAFLAETMPLISELETMPYG